MDGVGITPASQRAGGLTFWYHVTGDVNFVQWMAGLASRQTLEHYVQEVAALSLLPKLPEHNLARTLRFAAAAWS